MEQEKTIEIACSHCHQDAWLLREPIYEGFSKIGEKLTCSSCGVLFDRFEDVPFKNKRSQAVFSDDDRPAAVDVFESGENRVLCRYCSHYVVNPFTQFCSLHNKETAATDTCSHFDAAPENQES